MGDISSKRVDITVKNISVDLSKYLVGPYYTGPKLTQPYWRHFSNAYDQTLIDNHITPTLSTPHNEK